MRLVSKTMFGRRLLVLTMLSNCVLSLPLITGQLENEDVKVMKCIVEVLADVISRPRPLPVSQECLVTLKTDDRIVSVLRHQNFLKELQEIAVQGHKERAELQSDDPTTPTPRTAGDLADRSMVEALGGPGERSILSQESRTGYENPEGEKDEALGDEASHEAGDDAEEEQVKREDHKKPRGHTSEFESSEGKAEGSEEDEEENENKREKMKHSEENMSKDNKDAEAIEKSDAPRNRSKKKLEEDDAKAEEDKRSTLFLPKQHERPEGKEEMEEEKKRGSRESLMHWAKRGNPSRKGVKKEAQQFNSREEVAHHSKEISEEEEKMKRNKSPEEKELQTIARKGPEERRGLEEEGSAIRRSEELEIESLATIESELENVAQRLHNLRRG